MWWRYKRRKWDIKQTCRSAFRIAQEGAIKISIFHRSNLNLIQWYSAFSLSNRSILGCARNHQTSSKLLCFNYKSLKSIAGADETDFWLSSGHLRKSDSSASSGLGYHHQVRNRIMAWNGHINAISGFKAQKQSPRIDAASVRCSKVKRLMMKSLIKFLSFNAWCARRSYNTTYVDYTSSTNA